MTEEADGLRSRLTRQGEEALGRVVQELLENPVVSGAVAHAFEAREKATQAQQVAMGALNLPSASDLERLTRRVRSVSQRLEGIEDTLDRLDGRLGTLGAGAGASAGSGAGTGSGSGSGDGDQLGVLAARIDTLTSEVRALRAELPGAVEPVPRAQERMTVGDAPR